MLDYPEEDLYWRVVGNAQATYSEKGSKFISNVFPVNSEESVSHFLKELKKSHPKSRHVVYAFRLHPDSGVYRSSDDGEPSGSSGLPTFHALQSAALHETLVATVRYFGGTKLGVSGLIHAYRTAAEDALAEVKKEKTLLDADVDVQIPYAHLNLLYQIQRQIPFEIETISQLEHAVLRLRTARSLKTSLLKTLSEYQNIIFVL